MPLGREKRARTPLEVDLSMAIAFRPPPLAAASAQRTYNLGETLVIAPSAVFMNNSVTIPWKMSGITTVIHWLSCGG